MKLHKVVEGTGFGAGGPEENYLSFIDEATGARRSVSATELVPSDAITNWAHIEALVGGFGKEGSEERLEGKYAAIPIPHAYRVKITVEIDPLSVEETAALIAKAKEHELAWQAEADSE